MISLTGVHGNLTLLLTNSMPTKQQIFGNENLKIINLPNLILTDRLSVRHDPSPLLYTALSLSLTNHNLSLPPSLQVLQNPNLEKLCASELEIAGEVCIGNNQNQPFLDADLSKLAGNPQQSFIPDSSCYQDSNAPTVCGNGTDGVFSDDRCPSNACS